MPTNPLNSEAKEKPSEEMNSAASGVCENPRSGVKKSKRKGRTLVILFIALIDLVAQT